MIVRGGGISLDGERWIACRPGFFFPVGVLSRLFRRLVLEKLAAAHAAGLVGPAPTSSGRKLTASTAQRAIYSPAVRPLGEITCDVEDFSVRTSAFRPCRIMPSMRSKSWRWSGTATADARNTGTLPKAQKAT